MKKILILLVAILFLFVSGCGDDDGGSLFQQQEQEEESASSSKDITAFSIDGNDGIIDQTAGTIAVDMTFRDLSALVATFTTTGENVTVGPTAQVSGTTPNNFNSPVVYTVTAEDGTTRDYTATVVELERYQVFESGADNLVEGVASVDNYMQIYVHDMKTGAKSLVSVDKDGDPAEDYCEWATSGASITPDGRYAGFISGDQNIVDETFTGSEYKQVYLRDLQGGVTILISEGYDGNPGDNDSKWISISNDGNYIAYSSASTNIMEAGIADWDLRQVFLYNRSTGATTLVSRGHDGNPADECARYPQISADGRYVVFESWATNLVEGVDSGNTQIYRRDLEAGTISLVSVGYDGSEGDSGSYDSVISADGRYVAFYAYAENLIDGFVGNGYSQIFLRDMDSGTTSLVSVGSDGSSLADDYSYDPLISASGRYVFFDTNASNLVEGDDSDNYHVYVRDLETGTTSKVDVNGAGEEANYDSYMNWW